MRLLLLLLLVISYQIPAEDIKYQKFNSLEAEKSFKSLTEELRCLVCQNQTIADSNASLAKDLRRQVFEMLQQGKTEQDIKEYMLLRYGDFVLYKPPLKSKTILLWTGPIIFLLLGLAFLFFFVRKKRSERHEFLNPQQHQKIRQILEQDKE